MARNVFVRDIDILHRLNAKLGEFGRGTAQILADVAKEIERCGEHLEMRTRHWRRELRRREDELAWCRKQTDSKGRGLDCSREAADVREAEEAVEMLLRLISQLETANGEYAPYANRMLRFLGNELPKARGDIGASMRKYDDYLGTQSTASSGAAASGYDFQARMKEKDSAGKGAWGERGVLKEVEGAGHEVLVAHPEAPTGSGFDCVSFDSVSGELHIWEAKNWSDKGSVSGVGAWEDSRADGTHKKNRETKWRDVLNGVPEGPERERVKQALNEGKVFFHLRLGPETKITRGLRAELDGMEVPWAQYDWKHYSTEHMRSVDSED